MGKKVVQHADAAIEKMADTLCRILEGRQTGRPTASLAKSFAVSAGFITRHTERMCFFLLYSQAREIYDIAASRHMRLNELVYTAIKYFDMNTDKALPPVDMKKFVIDTLESDTASK